MKLRCFELEVELAGTTCVAKFQDGNLTIEGLGDADAAYGLLCRLAPRPSEAPVSTASPEKKKKKAEAPEPTNGTIAAAPTDDDPLPTWIQPAAVRVVESVGTGVHPALQKATGVREVVATLVKELGFNSYPELKAECLRLVPMVSALSKAVGLENKIYRAAILCNVDVPEDAA